MTTLIYFWVVDCVYKLGCLKALYGWGICVTGPFLVPSSLGGLSTLSSVGFLVSVGSGRRHTQVACRFMSRAEGGVWLLYASYRTCFTCSHSRLRSAFERRIARRRHFNQSDFAVP